MRFKVLREGYRWIACGALPASQIRMSKSSTNEGRQPQLSDTPAAGLRAQLYAMVAHPTNRKPSSQCWSVTGLIRRLLCLVDKAHTVWSMRKASEERLPSVSQLAKAES